MEPSDYPRRILLAVTGLSPQVVTETLFALAVQRQPQFVPTEIRLVTTQEGRERALLSLLHPKSGWFHRLRRDFALPRIAFDDSHVQVLENEVGEPLSDIRTPEDNARAADTITELVRKLTRDPEAALHLSIAGGRKTMGFYLGYALSLFGRSQDRLSHVLVTPPYESHPQFFYPTPESEVIHTLPPDSRPYDTREARVTLAEIPFVRLRDGLEQDLLEGRAGFSTVVAQAQRAVPPLALELRPADCMVRAGGEPFHMQPAAFALYWMVAERAHRGQPGIHWSDAGIEQELLGYYGRVVGKESGDYERALQAYSHGLTKENFDPAKARVKKALRHRLGRRSAPYQIKALEQIPGSRYHRYGLDLPVGAIRIASGKLPVGGISMPDAADCQPQTPDIQVKEP